jgi:hypothetical protein
LGSLVFHPPLGESVERRDEGTAVRGEAVPGRENRPLVKFAPRNDAVDLEVAQMLREHLLRDARYVAPQIARGGIRSQDQ